MAVKQTVVSDISATELTEDTHARIVISDHPAVGGASVELDVSTEEAGTLTESKVDLVSLAIYEPNKTPRRVVLDAAAFNEAFAGVDMEKLLKGARKVEDAPAKRTRRSSGTPSSPKVDYTSKEFFGVLHRGKVTEEEAALVRDNLEQANKNREKHGQSPIDPADPKEQARYRF